MESCIDGDALPRRLDAPGWGDFPKQENAIGALSVLNRRAGRRRSEESLCVRKRAREPR